MARPRNSTTHCELGERWVSVPWLLMAMDACSFLAWEEGSRECIPRIDRREEKGRSLVGAGAPSNMGFGWIYTHSQNRAPSRAASFKSRVGRFHISLRHGPRRERSYQSERPSEQASKHLSQTRSIASLPNAKPVKREP